MSLLLYSEKAFTTKRTKITKEYRLAPVKKYNASHSKLNDNQLF